MTRIVRISADGGKKKSLVLAFSLVELNKDYNGLGVKRIHSR